MSGFTDKSILVTGTARGLGRATALAFAKQGGSLCLVDVLGDRLEQTKREVEALGVACVAYPMDIAQRSNCIDAVAKTIDAFGRLDVLCNVAAIVRFHHVVDITPDEWEQILAINLSGPFYLSQAAIPHLIASHGNIVNVASQAAQMGTAYIVPYSVSKAALLHMTKSMAMEFTHEPIRINAVAPGTMNTEIGTGISRPDDLDFKLVERYSGMRPPSEPEEVAEVIVFVASSAAGSLHGACISADNGVTAG
jgi:NAD(P)-dependent dehydrogenase (short-subunit alcohol dehydrogenase family)